MARRIPLCRSARATHAAEFFWRFARRPFRLDQSIAFDQTNFNLHFLNNVELFGYPPYSVMRQEEEFPLSVDWTGYLPLNADEAIAVDALFDGDLRLRVDGVEQRSREDR